ncbi:hypothetical protein PHYPSEUDO_010183 [Phytophthora pseudosyringae]|uniref:Uncharacterized protein n=1 Tax=Phytophthora pseudosyringae TaxID=221518 RepID=A0A8T1W9W8_9STRA|nr:hypothetical protein PHYPSEUDO_010183 [Phytophthora pseudosyringae]
MKTSVVLCTTAAYHEAFILSPTHCAIVRPRRQDQVPRRLDVWRPGQAGGARRPAARQRAELLALMLAVIVVLGVVGLKAMAAVGRNVVAQL